MYCIEMKIIKFINKLRINCKFMLNEFQKIFGKDYMIFSSDYVKDYKY